MEKRSVMIITIILTMAVVASFAAGPIVNPKVQAKKPSVYAGGYYSPLTSAIKEHSEILKSGTNAEISGTIEKIIYGNGRMPVELTIKGDDGKEYEVELGPVWMFNATQLVLNTKVSVQGKEIDSKVVAFSVTFSNNQLVQLRNNEGIPVWAGRSGANISKIKEKIGNYMKYMEYMKNMKTYMLKMQNGKLPAGKLPAGK